jgi:VWFA-related protein
MTNKTKRFLSVLLAFIVVGMILQKPTRANLGSQSGSGQQDQTASKLTSQQTVSGDQQGQNSPKVVLSTSEVVLDVVARDKKGQPVMDLDSSNLEVYEDGKKQQVESFRLHRAEPSLVPPTATRPADEDKSKMRPIPDQNPFAGVNVVALVFDRLSIQGRTLAQRAALKCVSDQFRPDDFAGIFSIDLTLNFWQPPLRVLQPFTNNRDYIARAIDRMTVTAAARHAPEGTATTAGSNGYSADEASSDGPEFPPAGLSSGPDFHGMKRRQVANVEVDGLLAVIKALGAFEGRKAIVLFSEGMSTSPADPVTGDRLRSVVAKANAADVTFYTADAGGLRILSRSEYAVGAALGMLANETGGLFINRTNDLTPGLSRIGEEINTYYVLTYAPQNQEYDGRYRRITVKVNRPGVEIETRKGYYAVRKPNPVPVPDWEGQAMAILRSGRSENAMAMRAEVFTFPEPAKPGLVPVFVGVPASELTYEFDKQKNTYNCDFSIVALFKDLSNQVAASTGKHYQISVPADHIHAAKSGDILFYGETNLPGGLYFAEAIVYDTSTGKSSIRATDVEVPYSAGDDALRLSSVVVLRRAEALNETAAKTESPFHYGGALLYPNLGEPLSKTNDKTLAFYFDVYPPKKVSAPLKLTVEILENGKPLTSGSPALPSADADGRIQYVSALPLSGFQPGDYLLKITITQGKVSTSRVTSFTVQP